MRTFAIAAIMIALLSASAFAQRQPRTTRTDEQKQADTEVDKAYQNAIKNTGADKGKSAPAQDPWGAVRPSGTTNERR